MFKQTVDIWKRIWENRIFRHVFYWICIYAAFYAIVRPFETHTLAFKLSTFFTASGPVPVYLHLFVLGRFFERRKYPAYFIGLVIVLILSTAFSEYIFRVIEEDPDSHTSGLGIAIMFIVMSTGFRYYVRGVKQQYKLQEAEFKHLQTELALLKSQVNPHFFFNTLNNLYALSLDKSDRVPGVIMKLSELMRYVLDSSQKKMVPLEDELRFVENYVELEKLRLSGTPDIRLRFDGNPAGKRITPMLLVPFVENSFKHGMGNSANEGFITVVSEFRGENFRFIIENSKPGSASHDGKVSNGMGLTNVKRRLELLYPERYQLSIDEDEERYTVKLSVQL